MPLKGNWAPPDPGEAADYADQPKMSDLVDRTLAFVGPSPKERVKVGAAGEERIRVRLEFLVVLDQAGNHQAYEDYAVWQAKIIRQLEEARRAGQPGMIGVLRYPPGGAYEVVPANPKAEERAKDVLEANGWVPAELAARGTGGLKEDDYETAKRKVDDGSSF